MTTIKHSNLILMLLFLVSLSIASPQPQPFNLDAIYQFGDSYSDTGNINEEDPSFFCNRVPYGETFFNRPAGRCSDGLLMVDYLALAFKLPFLDPFLKNGGNSSHGVNFAVSGATAQDTIVLASKNITSRFTNSSFTVQLGWFQSHLQSLCSTPIDCKEKLRKSLFIMGPVGANDYFFSSSSKTIEEMYQMVPEVVQSVETVIKEVIDLGATKVVVPGNFPLGCLPLMLTTIITNSSKTLDDLHCLKSMNDLTKLHNKLLQQAINGLQQKHPTSHIVYADLYSSFSSLLQHQSFLGFGRNDVLKTCCGKGNNAYNFNSTQLCGSIGVPVCPNPGEEVNWDGIHLTQHAYDLMAKWLLEHTI